LLDVELVPGGKTKGGDVFLDVIVYFFVDMLLALKT